ncbi:MAG: hypothetical protein IIA27_08690 [Gemmatimonadetes bacterium]|nr:hypothetical protein [Gemmatimonadota bacterium]
MPVTMKLSKKFYDTLGEDLANEMVDWFNQVDTTYRTDLREFNELNFQRFDAKLEQRLAQYDAKLEQRLASYETKWEQRLAGYETTWERRMAQFRTEIHQEIVTLRGDFRSEISALRTELIKWMFGFWVTSTATSIGVAIAVVKALA